MRICFFGHRDFLITDELEKKLISVLYENLHEDCEFFFGGYGVFDNLAYKCVSRLTSCYKIQKTFVTPYITESYLKNQVEYDRYKYDQVVYPEIEKVPYKFAISARNKWMVEQSDLVICYITRSHGGAYQAVRHAKNIQKQIICLGNITK